MQLYATNSFALEYVQILNAALHATVEMNQRTKTRIKVLPGGVSFKLALFDGMLPTCGVRKTYPRSAAAEVAWFLQGTRDVTWLRNQCPLWDKFVEEDGVTVKNAYGYRWRKHFGRDQINGAVKALVADSSDRQVMVCAWDPSTDGLDSPRTKNVPCPTNFTLSMEEGTSGSYLHSSLFIRSSDLFVGLPYDVMGHAMLMQLFARTLGTALGSMHVTLAHAHLYEPHWKMAEVALRQRVTCPRIPMDNGHTIEIATANPDRLVAHYAGLAATAEWPSYNPLPEVIP